MTGNMAIGTEFNLNIPPQQSSRNMLDTLICLIDMFEIPVSWRKAFEEDQW
jgi:hypothetical protein